MAFQETPKSPVIMAVTAGFLPPMPPQIIPLTNRVEARVRTVGERSFDLSDDSRLQLLSNVSAEPVVMTMSLGTSDVNVSTEEALIRQLELLDGTQGTQSQTSGSSFAVPGRFSTPAPHVSDHRILEEFGRASTKRENSTMTFHELALSDAGSPIGLDAEAVEALIFVAVEPLATAITELENRTVEYATKSDIECIQTDCLSDLRAFVDHSRVDIMSDFNVEMLALRDELGVVRTSCVSAIKCVFTTNQYLKRLS